MIKNNGKIITNVFKGNNYLKGKIFSRNLKSVPYQVNDITGQPLKFSDIATVNTHIREPHLSKTGTYEEICNSFSWNNIIKKDKKFNIAYAICDRHVNKRLKPNYMLNLSIIEKKLEENDTQKLLSFRELFDISNNFAKGINSNFPEITKGDKISILLPAIYESAISHVTTYRLGCVSVPLCTTLDINIIQHRLQITNSKILITDYENYEKIHLIRSNLPDLELVILVDSKKNEYEELLYPKRKKNYTLKEYNEKNIIPFSKIINEKKELKGEILEETSGEDAAIILFENNKNNNNNNNNNENNEKNAKGIIHSHRSLLGALTGYEFLNNNLPMGIDGSMGFSNFYHTTSDWTTSCGLLSTVLPSLYYAVPLISNRNFENEKKDLNYLFKFIHSSRASHLHLTKNDLENIIKCEKGFPLHIVSAITESRYLTQEIYDKLWNGIVKINGYYGVPETGFLLGNCELLSIKFKENCLGKPVPGHHIEIIDDNGNVLPSGKVGKIACKKDDPSLFLGYLNDQDETDKKFINDWFITGDLGMKDENGSFYLSKE